MQFPLQIDAPTPGAFLHGMQEPDWFACTLWWPTEPLSGSGFVVKTKVVVRLFPGFVFLPGSWCSLCSFSFRDLHATTRDVLGLFVLFCHKNDQIVEWYRWGHPVIFLSTKIAFIYPTLLFGVGLT